MRHVQRTIGRKGTNIEGLIHSAVETAVSPACIEELREFGQRSFAQFIEDILPGKATVTHFEVRDALEERFPKKRHR